LGLYPVLKKMESKWTLGYCSNHFLTSVELFIIFAFVARFIGKTAFGH